ncbi:MAG: hypothetical protein ACTS7I_02345, partial [Candidatus Hodgkinia cicadicola]
MWQALSIKPRPLGLRGPRVRPGAAPWKRSTLRWIRAPVWKRGCSARRGLIDSTLKTATSGYFTRKLVEACREYMITEWDCET